MNENIVQCMADGKDAQPQLCQAANIQSVPTWDINGKFYGGEKSLEKLAEISGYTGDHNFKYILPESE